MFWAVQLPSLLKTTAARQYNNPYRDLFGTFSRPYRDFDETQLLTSSVDKPYSIRILPMFR